MEGSAPQSDTSDPFAGATRSCDAIMKGGITSGVVYPLALCELARTYRFRRIGGTSAGAMAAAACAAAEHGRSRGGFQKLAALGAWVGSDGHLFALFQPQRRTRRIFRLIAAGVAPSHRALALAGAALRGYGIALLLGAAPGIVLGALASQSGTASAIVGTALGAIVGLVGAGLGLLAGIVSAARAIPGNLYGLCSGNGGSDALTPWLADTIDDLAGRPTAGPPLTFGDLWRGPDGDGSAEDPRVGLQVMTTAVTLGRAWAMPWSRRDFFFDPEEFRALFPERVVAHMEAHPPPAPADPAERLEWQIRCHHMAPRRPLPDAADLPVVVAARMSLSFPVLLSAVPLWAVDMSRLANQKALDVWREWLDQGGQISDPAALPPVGSPPERMAGERCWFSDGGIASNFPIHLFDAPLPRWPTFGFDLRPFHPDYPPEADEARNVHLPGDNEPSHLGEWSRLPEPPLAALGRFVGTIVRTMQNRVDTEQSLLPGVRERIVQIHHTKAEGGMNLQMPASMIAALSERGRQGGIALVERYTNPAPDPAGPSWASHRWTRTRNSLGAAARWLAAIRRAAGAAPDPEVAAYAQLAARAAGTPPTNYPWSSDGQRAAGAAALDGLVAVAGAIADAGADLGAGAPEPQPDLRLAPRD